MDFQTLRGSDSERVRAALGAVGQQVLHSSVEIMKQTAGCQTVFMVKQKR